MLKLWVAIIGLLPVCTNAQKKIFGELVKLNAQSPLRDISAPFNSVQLVDYPSDSYTRQNQYFINDSNNIYLTIDGSGQLWKIDTNAANLLKRIDSTVYFGDNFQSAYFHYHNKLYNFGGYGFWQTTGILRYFDQQNQEWFLQELDRPYPFVTGGISKSFWIDYNADELYLLRPAYKEQGYTIPEFQVKNLLLKLNLKTFHWELLGEPDAGVQGIFDLQINPVLGIDLGLLAFSGNELILLDFKQNRVYNINQEKKNLFFSKAFRSKGKTLMASAGNFIYFGYFPNDRLDSIEIRRSDLIIKDNRKIFRPESSVVLADFMPAVLISVSVLVLYVGISFLRRRQKRLVAISPTEMRVVETAHAPARVPVQLPAVEKSLLQAFLRHYQEGKVVSQSDLNRLLGVSSKPPELQKKHRSDAIKSLNNWLMNALDTHHVVILKRRSEQDGRVFDYFISEQLPDELIQSLNNLSENDKNGNKI